MPENLETVSEYMFSECINLETVNFGNVTYISEYAFNKCEKLTNVKLPKNLRSIGWGAFTNCKSLTELTLPRATQTTGYYAFDGTALTDLYILNPMCHIMVDGLIYPPCPSMPLSTVIYGYENSLAQSYAQEFGNEFVVLDEYISGDADSDGEVSVMDASLIQMYLVGEKEISDEAFFAADADCDSEISVLDASLIQMYLVGKMELG